MALLNYRKREINAKIVYYGPGLSGKTTNVHYIHKKLRPEHRGKLMSLATQTDRTLFFDFLPVELGEIHGLHTRFQIYTVPGQVFYNATRKLVLKNVDGVVFVADSQRKMLGANLESLKNLDENLRLLNKSIRNIPLVIQYNKRDMDDIMTVEELEEKVNLHKAPHKLACAHRGEGVLDTLTLISKMVLGHLRDSPEFNRGAMEPPPPAPSRSASPRPPAVSVSASAAVAIAGHQAEDLEAGIDIAEPVPAAVPEIAAVPPPSDDLQDLDEELEETVEEEYKAMGARPQVVLDIVECKPAERVGAKSFRIPIVLTDSKGEREYLFHLTLSTDIFGGE